MPGVRKIEAGAKNCPVSFWNTLEIYTVWHWNISSRMTREREVNYSVGDVFGQVKKMNMVFLTIIVFFHRCCEVEFQPALFNFQIRKQVQNTATQFQHAHARFCWFNVNYEIAATRSYRKTPGGVFLMAPTIDDPHHPLDRIIKKIFQMGGT